MISRKKLLQQQQQQQQQATPVAVNHQQMQAQPQQTLSVQAGQVAGASPQVIQLQPVSSVISRKKLLNSAVCLLVMILLSFFLATNGKCSYSTTWGNTNCTANRWSKWRNSTNTNSANESTITNDSDSNDWYEFSNI